MFFKGKVNDTPYFPVHSNLHYLGYEEPTVQHLLGKIAKLGSVTVQLPASDFKLNSPTVHSNCRLTVREAVTRKKPRNKLGLSCAKLNTA